MKKAIFTIVLFLTGILSWSQVGINNTDPKASLDITATNVGSPTNTDGILIPRVDDFPLTPPTAAQDGMMLFVTGNGTPTKGFYYWDNALAAWQSVIGSKNTLDQAYDEGGAGVGSTIIADAGAVSITGVDGFQVTGTFNSGAALTLSGVGTRMFFNPNKAAFRAGNINGSQWDNTNVGDYSTAMGVSTTASGGASIAMGTNTTASGAASTAIGSNTIASGDNSTAMGLNITTPSYGETAIGVNGTLYTPNSTNGFFTSDRLFFIGNGIDPSTKSNALTIYKNGLMNINDEYNMPLTDGTANQIMQTDGAGQVNFVDPSTIGDGDTQNTLNQAYDEGGAGAGRTITADNGRVVISGNSEMLYLNSTNLTGTNQSTLDLNSVLNGNQGRGLNIGLYGTNPTSAPNVGETDAIRNYIRHSMTNGTLTGLSNVFVLGTNLGGFNTGFRGVHNSFYSNTNADGTNWGVVNNFLTTSNRQVGIENLFQNNAETTYGLWNHTELVVGSNYKGVYNDFNNNSTTGQTTYGVHTEITGSSTGNKYGTYNRINNLSAGLHYGIYSDVQNTNGYAGYFIGRMSLGNTTSNRYLMPAADGTANQIMQTDGAGQVSFVDPTIVGTDDQNLTGATLTGTSLQIDIENGTSTTVDLAGLQDADWFEEGTTAPPNAITDDIFTQGNVAIGKNTADYNLDILEETQDIALNVSLIANNNNAKTGLRMTSSGTGNGNHTGFLSILNDTGGGVKSGIINRISNSGNGIHYGAYNELTGNGTGTHYGSYNTINGSGNSSKYGSYNVIPNTAAGTHYGVYSSVLKTNSYAAFLLGRVAIGTVGSNIYVLPSSRGTNGQVMQTNGFGFVNWVDSNTVGTDDQVADIFQLIGNNLELSLENDGVATQTVNLSGYLDNTDNQNLTGATLTGTSLQIDIENGTSTSVNLASLANDWKLTGNTGTNPTTNFLGTTNNQALAFRTNNTERMRIATDGKLGVGTTTPNTKIVAVGTITASANATQTNKIDMAHGGANAFLNVVGVGNLDFRHEGLTGMTFTDTYRLGIGTTTPANKLSVVGTINLNEGIAAGTALRVNGAEALWYNGTYFSWGFGGTANYFSDNVGVGVTNPIYKLDVRATAASDWIAQIYNTSANANADGLKIRLGRTSAPTASNGFIGFFDGNGGVGTPRGRIEGNGSGVTYNTTSDRRLKQNIKNINQALSLIRKIQPRTYAFKKSPTIEEYGFIAQELQQIYPQAVSGSPDSDVKTNPMMVDYSRLTPILTAGIKELDKKIESQQKDIALLKEENTLLKQQLLKYQTLEERLTSLENKIENIPSEKLFVEKKN